MWYGQWMTNRLPVYLDRGLDIKTIARFRLGSKERSKDKWSSEKERKCRICGTEEETIEHLTTTCCPADQTEEEIMGEEGQGVPWMKYVLESRSI